MAHECRFCHLAATGSDIALVGRILEFFKKSKLIQ